MEPSISHLMHSLYPLCKCNDAILVSRRLNSTSSWLFIVKLVLMNNNDNMKAPHRWPFGSHPWTVSPFRMYREHWTGSYNYGGDKVQVLVGTDSQCAYVLSLSSPTPHGLLSRIRRYSNLYLWKVEYITVNDFGNIFAIDNMCIFGKLDLFMFKAKSNSR